MRPRLLRGWGFEEVIEANCRGNRRWTRKWEIWPAAEISIENSSEASEASRLIWGKAQRGERGRDHL